MRAAAMAGQGKVTSRPLRSTVIPASSIRRRNGRTLWTKERDPGDHEDPTDTDQDVPVAPHVGEVALPQQHHEDADQGEADHEGRDPEQPQSLLSMELHGWGTLAAARGARAGTRRGDAPVPRDVRER